MGRVRVLLRAQIPDGPPADVVPGARPRTSQRRSLRGRIHMGSHRAGDPARGTRAMEESPWGPMAAAVESGLVTSGIAASSGGLCRVGGGAQATGPSEAGVMVGIARRSGWVLR